MHLGCTLTSRRVAVASGTGESASMRLTSFTDYSLRVLIYLAVRENGKATIAEISESFQVSEHHLVKVVHFLGKAGFLTNSRGRSGGVRLAMAPEDVNIGAVVRATETDIVPAECFAREGGHCRITTACRLIGVLQEAVDAFFGALDGYTLADISGNPKPLARLLFPAIEGGSARTVPS